MVRQASTPRERLMYRPMYSQGILTVLGGVGGLTSVEDVLLEELPPCVLSECAEDLVVLVVVVVLSEHLGIVSIKLKVLIYCPVFRGLSIWKRIIIFCLFAVTFGGCLVKQVFNESGISGILNFPL